MLVSILTACAPIIVALVGIIPTIIANRKKTEKTLSNNNVAMEKRLAKMQSTLDAHIKEGEVDRAKSQRVQILRFYDEIVAGRKHSESVFEDIIDMIDEYEKYCEAHPVFKNSRGQFAMKHIRDTYDTLKSGGKFEIKE